MSNPLVIGKDLGDITLPVPASAYVAATAGGSGDNTAVTGLTIDRFTLQPTGASTAVSNEPPTSALFELYYECALGAANTITIKSAKLEDSADGTNWATVFDSTASPSTAPSTWPASGVVDTGGTGGTTQRGVVAFNTNIKQCRRYVRFDWTPDLSAANTDTGKFTVTAVLSGFAEVPPGVV